MTDAEILKALICCSEHNTCNKCSYSHTPPECCDIDMLKDAAALINRQKAEIEALQKAKADDVLTAYKIQKTEAIKYFADRLQDKIRNTPYNVPKGWVQVLIDNLIKEMEGDDT